MDLSAFTDGLNAVKGAVDLLKSAVSLFPKGESRAAIESRIQAAEASLQESNVTLAREWGMKLCDCSFPPQIMLWKEPKKAHACPSCGHEKPFGMRISPELLKKI